MSLLNTVKRSYGWLVAELIVVVVGILIAIQFDAWNTARQEKDFEVIALT